MATFYPGDPVAYTHLRIHPFGRRAKPETGRIMAIGGRHDDMALVKRDSTGTVASVPVRRLRLNKHKPGAQA